MKSRHTNVQIEKWLQKLSFIHFFLSDKNSFSTLEYPWIRDYSLLSKSLKIISSASFLDILREQNCDYVCAFEADYKTGVKII